MAALIPGLLPSHVPRAPQPSVAHQNYSHPWHSASWRKLEGSRPRIHASRTPRQAAGYREAGYLKLGTFVPFVAVGRSSTMATCAMNYAFSTSHLTSLQGSCCKALKCSSSLAGKSIQEFKMYEARCRNVLAPVHQDSASASFACRHDHQQHGVALEYFGF